MPRFIPLATFVILAKIAGKLAVHSLAFRVILSKEESLAVKSISIHRYRITNFSFYIYVSIILLVPPRNLFVLARTHNALQTQRNFTKTIIKITHF